jgi:hypothetical protein
MKPRDREVRVTEGERLIQIWRCPETKLPNGDAGVLWRGVAFRLLEGDRIDVSLPTTDELDPDHCCALIPGEDCAWVLVPGTEARLHVARQRLADVSVAVRRYGRWLGEPSGGAIFDWFLCCDGPVDIAAVMGALGQLSVTKDELVVQRLGALQARANALRLEAAREKAETASARREAREIRSPEATPAPSLSQAGAAIEPHEKTQIAEQLCEALSQIEALTADLEAARERRLETLPTSTIRLMEELRAVLGATRPDVTLLRDSWQVLAGEFRSRDGFWRAVGELPPDGSRPNGWKSFRSADRWWERHVSNGADDTGRAYARFDTGTRSWGVLLGWKAEQDRDSAWLKRQG